MNWFRDLSDEAEARERAGLGRMSPREACSVLRASGVREVSQNDRHVLFMMLGEDPKPALAEAGIGLDPGAATYV